MRVFIIYRNDPAYAVFAFDTEHSSDVANRIADMHHDSDELAMLAVADDAPYAYPGETLFSGEKLLISEMLGSKRRQ